MSELGVSVDLRESLFRGGEFIRTLIDELEGYSHTISAVGGYDKATFTITGSISEIEEWFENGLGRDVTVYDEAAQVIWSGFVDKVGISIGGRSITIGPLMDISNRVTISYSPLDTSVTPPVAGDQTFTDPANDTTSQARYGILAEVFSADQATDANALDIRDLFLQEHKDPEQDETLSLESGAPSVAVECVGYFAYLKRYFYSSVAVGSTTISAKLQTILAADPNAIISTDYGLITANTLPTPIATDEKSAWSVIGEELAKGDATKLRYTFGVYQDRKAVYAPAPATFDYQFSLAEQRLELYGGGEIMPWQIRPARWLVYTDFMPGRSVPASIRSDPRALFLESVTYTAPAGLSITGGKVKRLPQIMAQLGLGGAT